MKLIKYLVILIWLVVISACKPELEPVEFSSGEADFSTYIAIGNSLTAGYADDALYKAGQENSYPNIISKQMKLAGGSEFVQPMMPTDAGATWSPEFDNFPPNLLKFLPKYTLQKKANCKGNTSLTPVRFPGAPDEIFDFNGENSNLYIGGPVYNNLGVPGLRAVDMNYVGLGNLNNILSGRFNPFFWRFSSDQQDASVISDAVRAHPTFFTMWIGSNDVLLNIVSGLFPITPLHELEAAIETALAELATTGAKGVIANIPNVLMNPFFTTIPYNGLSINEQRASELNDFYAAYPNISFTAGENPFIIEDGNIPNGRRQIAQDEFIKLTVPQDSLKCASWGAEIPIPAEYIVTSSKAQQISNTVKQYNQIIAELAEKYSLGMVDINEFLAVRADGFIYNGIDLNIAFVSGGIFSLDGIHLTPRGAALVANEFIRVINEKYNATVPYADVTDYHGVLFP